MKHNLKCCNKYIFIFLIIPVIYMYGGIENVLKLDATKKDFELTEIVFEGISVEETNLQCEQDKVSIGLNNINSQVKNVNINLEKTPTQVIEGRLYFNNGGEYAEQNSYKIKLRKGENMINVPTHQHISEIKLVLNNAMGYEFSVGSLVKLNTLSFSFVSLLSLILNLFLVFMFKNIEVNKVLYRLYISVSMIAAYMIYGVLLYYPTNKIILIVISITCISQLFFKSIFMEVNEFVEKNQSR